MGYKNYTIRGKTDGFGCQYNAKLSGLAFCLNSGGWPTQYRYIHTPFATVSHGWRKEDRVAQLNEFIGIPDNRIGKRIHVPKKFETKVFNDPNAFYNSSVLDTIREYYWSTPKPQESENEIVVHIRRGDVQPHNGGDRARRHLPNVWYNTQIPDIVSRYPSHYKITIHSEGEMPEFESITDGWPQDIVDRTVFKLDTCLTTAFHEMVTAKVLLMSKSGFAYTSAILNTNDIFFVRSGARGQKIPLGHWIRTPWGG